MRLLYRDTSAYMFMTLGGLISKKEISNKTLSRPRFAINSTTYLDESRHFGNTEPLVVDFISKLLSSLGWSNVKLKHDVFATSAGDKLLIECKAHKPKVFYLDEHTWKDGKTADEELHEHMDQLDVKWGCLTDGITLRVYYSKKICPELAECYIEFDIENMMRRINSTGNTPVEYHLLIDILSPESNIRKIDPSVSDQIPEQFLTKIKGILKKHGNKSLKTVMKSLAALALEDMGIRPTHKRNFGVIKNCKSKREFISLFEDIQTHSLGDFHSKDDFISDDLCADISLTVRMFNYLNFAHIDHSFLGEIYQKAIKNDNASHYTPSYLSREMALYLAGRSEKTQLLQKKKITKALNDDEYIIDPAVGSGQLLRALLPYHKLFFDGTTRGIDGWRKLASHFMARDIDSDAVWIAKLSIWLATAKKGQKFLCLGEFKQADVIDKSINRKALSYREAFAIPSDKNIAAIISNPPWDAFKNDARRGVSYDDGIKESVEKSLGISARQLNRAQIFTKIIHEIGKEQTDLTKRNVRFAVILPDSFFVDQTQGLRDSLRSSIDIYFSFPRNDNPITGTKVFPDVDRTKKFGIIFGISKGNFVHPICYPFGNKDGVLLNFQTESIGNYKVFPLFAHEIQAKIKEIWCNKATRFPKWREGEFHQSNWNKVTGRAENVGGIHKVIGGTAFCVADMPWSQPITSMSPIKMEMSSISTGDVVLKGQNRLLFSDYIQNSAKPNSAAYLSGGLFNAINTIVFSSDCILDKNDGLILDSLFFSPFVEAYGTSQHMNAWRLTSLGLVDPILSTDALKAMEEIALKIDITAKELYSLYKVSYDWIKGGLSPAELCDLMAHAKLDGYVDTISEIQDDLYGELSRLEKTRSERLAKKQQRKDKKKVA